MATPSTADEASSQQQTPPASSWTGNVWIQDEWTEEDKSEARDRLVAASSQQQQRQQTKTFNEFRRNASTNWNVFYRQNKTNFFKDRHYLHKAFPDEFGWLYAHSDSEDGAATNGTGDDDNDVKIAATNYITVGNNSKEDISIVEIGCGVGNAILPLLEQHTELMKQYKHNNKESKHDSDDAPPLPQLHIHCLDFAPTAIQLLKKDPRFQLAASEGRATAHVYDLSSMNPSTIYIGGNNNPDQQQQQQQSKVLANSADVAILLFCLSAIGPHPSPSLDRAARHVIDMLKPGGILVIRDYGRLDEAQLKLGTGEKELGENFYRKGDGTGCYYFELDDLKDLFVNNKDEDSGNGNNDKLELLELDYIQRVYRNRGDGTTRRRVWVQGRFRKPTLNEGHSGSASANSAAAKGSQIDSTDVLKQFLDTSVKRWDEHYRRALSTRSILPSNLFQIFPEEFQPWVSWQPSTKKGRRQHQFQPSSSPTLSEVTVIDLGCGLGNHTLLDLVEKQQLCYEEAQQQNQQQECQPASSVTSKLSTLNAHFLDASVEAMQRLRSDPRYQCAVADNEESTEEPKSTAATITSQVFNLASTQTAVDHLEQSANIVLLLFTLSAIGPYQQQHPNGQCKSGVVSAVQNAARMLKPGGVILFRDYGRYDDDQLQLNSVVGAQLCDNYYVRRLDDNADADCSENESSIKGTGCYFFGLEEARELFTNAGLEVIQLEYITRVYKKSGKNGRDCSKNGGVVNRTRVWIQGRFRKPVMV